MRTIRSALAIIALIFCAAASAWATSPADYLPRDPLRQAIEAHLQGDGRGLPHGWVGAQPALQALYGEIGYAPLWVNAQGPLGRSRGVLAVLSAADTEGLEPSAYAVEALDRPTAAGEVTALAAYELAVSAAVMRYGHDLHVGRLDPGQLSHDIDIERRPFDGTGMVRATAAAADVADHLASLAPALPRYEGLRKSLAVHRVIAAAGGWPTVPDGPTLRLDDTSDRVPALRARLAVTGDYAGDPASQGLQYGPELEAAVRAFQERHGLLVDGVVGRDTMAALNTDVDTRIDQIVATMERLRWLPGSLGERYIMVNAADFQLDLVENGETVRNLRVVIGLPNWQTPLFSSTVRYLEWNPSWTVPISIAVREVLPQLQEDPAYLEQEDLRLFAGWQSDAPEISAHDLDWEEIGSGIRYFMLRQPPGPGNPLGRVKFNMSNQFSVYMHDTSAPRLFERARRAFSHGCVRVDDALWLAEHLLEEDPDWAAIRDRVLEGQTTTRVNLTRPIPFHIVYHTAWRDDQGRYQFREDLYGIDRLVIDALAEHSAGLRRQLALAD